MPNGIISLGRYVTLFQSELDNPGNTRLSQDSTSGAPLNPIITASQMLYNYKWDVGTKLAMDMDINTKKLFSDFADNLHEIESRRTDRNQQSRSGKGIKGKRVKALATLKSFFVNDPDRNIIDKSNFTQLDPTRLYLQLVLRVLEPRLISQADFGICGPASIAILQAKVDPEAYVDFAINLLRDGNAIMGSRTYSPGPPIKTYGCVNKQVILVRNALLNELVNPQGANIPSTILNEIAKKRGTACWEETLFEAWLTPVIQARIQDQSLADHYKQTIVKKLIISTICDAEWLVLASLLDPDLFPFTNLNKMSGGEKEHFGTTEFTDLFNRVNQSGFTAFGVLFNDKGAGVFSNKAEVKFFLSKKEAKPNWLADNLKQVDQEDKKARVGAKVSDIRSHIEAINNAINDKNKVVMFTKRTGGDGREGLHFYLLSGPITDNDPVPTADFRITEYGGKSEKKNIGLDEFAQNYYRGFIACKPTQR